MGNDQYTKELMQLRRLQKVVRRLRAEDGCPWDRAQTHASLKPPCIEEAAEVICGINILEQTGNPDNLKEELGDLLLQVLFHAQIAEEEGYFTLEDVAAAEADKMVRRHPHVFGEKTDIYAARTREEQKALWEEIKKAEKEHRSLPQDVENKFLAEAMEETKALIDVAEKRKGFV